MLLFGASKSVFYDLHVVLVVPVLTYRLVL